MTESSKVVKSTKRTAKPKAKVKVGPSQKHIEAAERVRASTIGAGEPNIDLDQYPVSLIKAMTYYNVYEDPKVKRKWVQKYLGQDVERLKMLDGVPDSDLFQLSSIIRLKERNQPLKENELKFIETKLHEILTKSKSNGAKLENTSAEITTKPVLSIAEKIANVANTYIAELEGELDEFSIKKTSSFNMKDYIEMNQISPQVAKHIANWFKKTETELTLTIAGKDEQLVEGYGYFKPAQLKKYLAFVTSIISACTQQKVKAVRTKKVKPPSEVIKNVKYMTDFAEFGLKSEHPTKLINSNEVWLYNTKTRRMTVLKAPAKDILIIKSTSIINFDTSKSETKTIRKPEEFFKIKINKKDLNSAWTSLTTKPATSNGRIGDDTIIFAIF